ncbi:MAG: ATP synthase F1 subunit gamma [Acidobacteria bacterium]|nr:ATP synthase F1 subunit gamma [Acidobacteriota bacterium]
MPSVRDFRTRIRSVKSTQQITRAMKLVAAAKLRRAQERIITARPYAGKMREVLASLASRAEPDRHPILARRPEKRVIVLVLSADKGLCGSFNTNILNRARTFLDGLSELDVKVDVVGRKARDWFHRRDYAVRRVVVDIFRVLSLQHAQEIATDLVRSFVEKECDAVYMIYNEFKSAIQQNVVVEPLLPIPRETFAEEEKKEEALPGGEEDYIYEPSQEELFASLLPKHVDVQVYRALLESSAAENGARMAAMDNATRNAGEMIESLTLQMNKIRQASITKEILEVISGADALK